MTDVWQDSFNKLSRVHGKDVLDNLPLLITEVPLNPPANRETMVEIMFETFRVPNLNVSMPGALVIQSTGGRTTGVVVDCGGDVTHIVPVYEGHIISSAVVRIDFAGRHVTESLVKMLSETSGYSFSTASNREVVNRLKENHCYVPSFHHARSYSAGSLRRDSPRDPQREHGLLSLILDP